mmetsp:Transcript_19369/g.32444  ORF Transcript_19369/g.32444 Transcript_19369/m.32444 type:complete len:113 (-) Transcript_19369:5127-5465(-)
MSGDAFLCSARKVQQQWNMKNPFLQRLQDTTLQEHELFKSRDAPSLERFYWNGGKENKGPKAFLQKRVGLEDEDDNNDDSDTMKMMITMTMMTMMTTATTTRMDNGRRRRGQ